MDLNTIVVTLREQAAANSTIVLDGSVLADETVRQKISAAFALKTGAALTIADVKPRDIPEPGADGVLTIAGGKASLLLNQTDVAVSLTFTAANGGVDVMIVAKMSDSWTFKDSFKDLDTFPFTWLKISGARFVFTTVDHPSYAWPEESTSKIPLAAGLNLLSHVTPNFLSSVPSPVRELIGDVSRKFYGSLTFDDGQHWPTGTLQAPLTDGHFEIGDNTIKLALSGPKLAVRIGESTDDFPVQQLDLLVQADFQNALQVAVGIPIDGGALEVSTTPLSPGSSVAALIKQLPGGNFTQYIPSELSALNLFDKVGLKNFSLLVNSDRKVTYLGLSIDTAESWDLIPSVLKLEKLTLKIETVGDTDLNSMRANISATAVFLRKIFTDDLTFNVELEKSTSWQVKTINGAYYGSVSLSTLASQLLPSGAGVPNELKDIKFSDFGVNAYKVDGEFTYTVYGSVEAAFPILGRDLIAALNVTITKNGANHSIHLGGGLAIGEQVFSLSLDVGQSSSKLEAKWEGTALGFGEIAAAFGWDSVPQLPEVVDIKLKKASFDYDFRARTLALSAESVSGGQVIFISRPAGSGSSEHVYFFSLGVPLKLEFSKLPVVGESLPANMQAGVDKLQITAASAAPTKTDVTVLQERAGKELIPDSLGKGVTLGALLQLDGPHTFILPLNGTPRLAAPEQLAVSGEAANVTALATSSPYRADAKWFELKKTLGPVYFDKVGVQYQASTLRFLLNAALSVAGLTLSVDGLSVGSSLKEFEPQFELAGLGIDYKAGDIEIGGAFLKTSKDNEPPLYEGAAVIKTKQFAVSALGSYTKLGQDPSLFIYAFLDYPLGGPSFFFVTGLAAGFGYNRRLIAPSIDKVAEFPLVTQAIRGRESKPANVMKALEQLKSYVPPDVGSIFLAVGVKFNSFKLVDSFALLTIEFGNNLAINLLGISTAIVPTPDAGKAVTPLAQIQIAWKATYNPDEGCLGIDARLTPNSYILSKDCRLSGGYAFYSWFSGPHAGDFVQTLGGYHPEFAVPPHYPKVPRLAFDWRVSSSLTIQGNAYYALTGSALMAGGFLEVLFRQGELRAWLKVEANFLIAWKPYHYDAFLSVNVGASYTFDINLLFTRVRVTISVDVGAQLHLWGPDFSGTARIDLSVISFTIAFGAGASQTPPAIKEWSNFQQSFLPAKDVCSIAVRDGLVKKIEEGGTEHWIVNPKQLSLVVDSAIPFRSAASIGKDKNDLPIENPNRDFGIGPMGVTKERLTISELTVTVKRGDGAADREFAYTVIKKTVPRGLWGEKVNPDVNNPFIVGVASGVEITPANHPEAGQTTAVDPKVFQFANAYYPNGEAKREGDAFAWEPGGAFVPSSVTDPRAKRTEIRNGIESNALRKSLLEKLGVTIDVNVRKGVADDFVSAPQIGTL